MRSTDTAYELPRVRASIVHSVVAGAREVADQRGRQLPPDPLPPGTDPYAWVPMAHYLNYLEDAAFALGAPELGLELGARFELTGLGPLGLLFMSSQTPFDAFVQLKIFLQAWQEDTEVHVESDVDLYSWAYRISTPTFRSLRTQDALLSLSVIISWLRARLGMHWNPVAVHFEQPAPPDQTVLKRFFRAPLFFARPTNGLFVDRQDGDRRAREQMPLFVPFMQRHLKDLMELPERKDNIVEAVRGEVARRLGVSPVTHDALAKSLGLSSRTLQRRLADAGFGLRRIVEEERRLITLDILGKPGTSSGLARQLGYADAATACRAVRRLTGDTPTGLAAKLRNGHER